MAEKLGVSREWLDRLIRGEVPLGAETCLRLALDYGEDALSLMRAAGKDDLAELLERAGFGAGDITARDFDFLRALASLPETQQRLIRELVRSLSGTGSAPLPRKTRKRS